jgi:hypothetical protein
VVSIQALLSFLVLYWPAHQSWELIEHGMGFLYVFSSGRIRTCSSSTAAAAAAAAASTTAVFAPRRRSLPKRVLAIAVVSAQREVALLRGGGENIQCR